MLLVISSKSTVQLYITASSTCVFGVVRSSCCSKLPFRFHQYYVQKHTTVCGDQQEVKAGKTSAHLQHVGEIHSDTLHQQAVGSQLGVLPAGDVGVALTDQNSHLLHDGARVHVVTQSLVDGKLPVVETTQHKTLLTFSGQCDCFGILSSSSHSYLLLSSISSTSHFSKRPVRSVGARRMSFTFRKNSC